MTHESQSVVDTDQEGSGGGPALHFEHIASLHTVTVHTNWAEILNQAWDEAYVLLGEVRRDGDRLQTDDGIDATPYLTWSIRRIHDEKVLRSHKFQIVGPTGGARR
jgi:hypothetical protein